MRPLLLALTLCVIGCAADAGPDLRTAHDVVAIASVVAEDRLRTAYQDEGLSAIAASSTREEAQAKLQAIRTAWKPVWAAWDALAHADAALIACSDRCDQHAALEVLSAWCSVRVAAVVVKVQIPDPVGVCPP